MPNFNVGYFVGSLSSRSINRVLSRALIRLAPDDLAFTELPIGNLPLYSPDFDSDYPPEAVALKEAIARSDAVLFVTPEYNRSIPGGVGAELLRPRAGRGDRRVHRPDRDRPRATEPARGVELLQRPRDDVTRGIHPVRP
jgi:hypothetical protein